MGRSQNSDMSLSQGPWRRKANDSYTAPDLSGPQSKEDFSMEQLSIPQNFPHTQKTMDQPPFQSLPPLRGAGGSTPWSLPSVISWAISVATTPFGMAI